MSIVIWFFLAAFILIFASGIYVFVLACVRRKELPWMVEEEIKKTNYARYYNCISASDAWLKQHNAQSVFAVSKDGLNLHAFWIPVENPRGTVLLAHGYRSTMLVDFGLAFAFYHALGMNILVPHQRAHGKSEGKYITFGVKESEDMKCWINYHNQNLCSCQMFLSGMSMGASTVLYLADQNLPENVKCLIADCGFTSPWAILNKVYRTTIHLPSGASLFVANLLSRIFAGFSLKEKDTRVVLKNAKLPVLLIHGLNDNFVPYHMTRQGYEACTSKKRILLVEGAGHGISFLVDKESYTKAVISFLEENLNNF